MKLITVTPGGETTQEVEKTEYFCPNCGVHGLLCERGEGDYYMGSSFYCIHCKHGLYIPVCVEEEMRLVVEAENKETT